MQSMTKQASKDWGEGVALRETVFLDEEIKRAIWAMKKNHD
jgi:hypothetical protein